MLAIYWGLMTFRPFIEMQEFEVWTDHSALCHILKKPLSNSRETRYAMELSSLYGDFPIKHIPGKSNVQSDWLSRNALDAQDDKFELENLYYAKPWKHDSLAAKQAAEDVLEKGRELEKTFGKLKIVQRRPAPRRWGDTPTAYPLADTDAETPQSENQGDAETSLTASDTPLDDAQIHHPQGALLYMTEALEITDKARCAQRCNTCAQHYMNDRNSKFSLNYYLAHLNSDKHRGTNPTLEIQPETGDYLQRLAKQETEENRTATGLAMITALTGLLPIIDTADMRSCTLHLSVVGEEENDLYQLVLRDRLLQTEAIVLGGAILGLVTKYIHQAEMKASYSLNIGPSFNGLAITTRPLISSFVHKNPRNTKEDETNFCAQVILMKHQVDQIQWETIAVPQAKETKTLLQMLIYDILTRKGKQPSPPASADPSLEAEKRGEINRRFMGRAERHLWLHNTWGTREFFEHLWDDHHRGRLSNQLTPRIIAGAFPLPKDPKANLPKVGEISAETRKALIREQKKDPYLSPLRKLIMKGNAPGGITAKTLRRINHQKDNHIMMNGTLRKIIKEGHDTYTPVVIPQSFKQRLLEMHHDTPSMCHLGIHKTYKIIYKRIYWDNLKTDLKRFIKGCITCTQRKAIQDRKAGLIQSIDKGLRPWNKISIDFHGNFPTTARGNKYVFSVMDTFTRYPVFVATKDMTAETAAQALVDNVFTVFGSPSIILSDRGRNFLGDTIKELCKIYHIKKENTSAFHPQANSISERSHRTIDNHLSTLLTRFAKENQTDWDLFLQLAAYSMRVASSDGTGFSPFFANFGRECRLPIDNIFPPQMDDKETLSEHAIRTKAVLARVHDTMTTNAEHMRTTANAMINRSRHAGEFQVGDKVMVYNPETIRRRADKNQKIKTASKILPKWSGPYSIAETFDHQPNVVVVIPMRELGASKPTKEIINISRITKFTSWDGPTIPQRWRGNIMRKSNEYLETHKPSNVEAEAEEEHIFALEELITKLTAKDPLENRLTQLNEYIASMQEQLMVERTEPERDYEKAYTKLHEIETEFSRVMRAEDFYEQKLRIQCSQPHVYADEDRTSDTTTPNSIEGGLETQVDIHNTIGAQDVNTKKNIETDHNGGKTKRKTVPHTTHKGSKPSSNKRRKLIKKSMKAQRLTEAQQNTEQHQSRLNTNKQKTPPAREAQSAAQSAQWKSSRAAPTPLSADNPTPDKSLGRGKRLKKQPTKHRDDVISLPEQLAAIRKALWRHKQRA